MKHSLSLVVLMGLGLVSDSMAQGGAVRIGEQAPAPVLLTLSGDSYKFMSDLYGEETEPSGGRRSAVILFFMESNSEPCASAMPAFMEVARKVHEKESLRGQCRFFLVSVDASGQRSALSSFLNAHGVAMPVDVLLDPKQKAREEFQVGKLPRTFSVSRSGILEADIEGVPGHYRQALMEGVVKAMRAGTAARVPVREARPDRKPSGSGVSPEPPDNPNLPMQW